MTQKLFKKYGEDRVEEYMGQIWNVQSCEAPIDEDARIYFSSQP